MKRLPEPLTHGNVSIVWRRNKNRMGALIEVHGSLICRLDSASTNTLRTMLAAHVYDLARNFDHVHTALRLRGRNEQ